MSHILIQIFAGIGLFFVGVTFLSNNIKKVGSKHAPKVIATLAKNDLTSAIAGVVSGIITNSGKAVTFTLVGLCEAGLINFRKSMPIIMGGSIGSAFIVLWASFNFEVVVYLLLGIAGLYFQFGDRKNLKTRVISGIVLGFGLLFYGLEMIKLGAAPIKTMPWFEHYILLTQGHWFFALVIGAVLALVSQSGSSVAIIAISLVNAGILGVDEAIMLVFGTNVGSGISTAMLGLGLNGMSRRLVMFHGFFKIVGVFILVPLLYWEVYGNIPLIKNFVSHYSSHASMQIATIYLLYEVITGIVVGGLLNPIAYWFDRLHGDRAKTGEVLADSAAMGETATPAPVGLGGTAAKIVAGVPSAVSNGNSGIRPPASLQVAILYTPGNEHETLRSTLESHNVHVVAHQLIDANWRDTLDQLSADILLLNMSEDFEEQQELLNVLMAESRMPVVFNDRLHPHSNLAELGVDWVRRLVHKFHLLAGKSAQPATLEA